MFKMEKIIIVLYLLISSISAFKITSKTAVSDNINGLTEKEDHTATTRNVNEEKSILNLKELLNESKLMLDHSNYSSKDSFVTIQYYKPPKRDKDSSKNNDLTLKIIKIHTTPSYEIKKLETDRTSRGVQEVVGNKHDENKVSKSSASVNEITKFESIKENLEKDAMANSNVRSSVDDVMKEFQYIRRNNVPIEKLDETPKIHSIVEDAEKEVRADSNTRMSLEDLKRELKSDHRNNEPVEKVEEISKVQNIEEVSEEEVPSDSSVRSSIDSVANEFQNSRRNNKPIEKLEKMTTNNENLEQKVTAEPLGKSSVGNDEPENEFESTRKDNDSINKIDAITEEENINENIEKEAESSFRSSNDGNGHEQHYNPINNDDESVEYFKENEYPYQKLNEELNKKLKETGDLSIVRTDLYDVTNIVNKLARPQDKNIEPVAAPKTATIPEHAHAAVTNNNNDKNKMDTTGLMRLLQTKMYQNPGVFNARANPVGLKALLGHKTDNLNRYGLLPDKVENIHPQENYQETITQLKSSKITDDFSLRELSLINPYMPLTLEKILHGNIGRKDNPTLKLIQPLINLRSVVNLNKQNLFQRQFSNFRPNIVALPSIGRYS